MKRAAPLLNEAIKTEKYGSTYYHTVYEDDDNRESPKAAMQENAQARNHSYQIVHESPSPHGDNSYISFGSYPSINELVQILHRVPRERHRFYEVCVHDKPLFLFFDCEWYMLERDDADTASTLCAIHRHIVEVLREIIPGYDVALPLISTDSRDKSPTEFKESFHLIYTNVILENNHDTMKRLYGLIQTRIIEADPEKKNIFIRNRKYIIDWNMFSTDRHFRVLFSGKCVPDTGTCLVQINNEFLRSSIAQFSRQSITKFPWDEQQSPLDKLKWQQAFIDMSITDIKGASVVVRTQDLPNLRPVHIGAKPRVTPIRERHRGDVAAVDDHDDDDDDDDDDDGNDEQRAYIKEQAKQILNDFGDTTSTLGKTTKKGNIYHISFRMHHGQRKCPWGNIHTSNHFYLLVNCYTREVKYCEYYGTSDSCNGLQKVIGEISFPQAAAAAEEEVEVEEDHHHNPDYDDIPGPVIQFPSALMINEFRRVAMDFNSRIDENVHHQQLQLKHADEYKDVKEYQYFNYTFTEAGQGQYEYNTVSIRRTSGIVIIIKSPMGTGKSERLARCIIKVLEDNPNARILAVSSRIQLAWSFKGDNRMFKVYRELRRDQWSREPRLIIEYESLHGLDAGTTYDYVIIDEIETLWDTTICQATNKQHLLSNGAILQAYFRSRQTKVILLDADVSHKTFDLIQEMMLQKEITVHHNTHIPQRGTAYIIQSEAHWFQAWLELLEQGKRVVFPCASKEQALKIKQRVEALGHGIVVKLYVSGKGDMDDFLDIGQAWGAASVVIYTSKVKAAASFKIEGHFYCIFLSATAAGGELPRGLMQMVERVRSRISMDVFIYAQTTTPTGEDPNDNE